MKIEDQCCTLEQAKRLEELGIIQESLFVWKCNDVQNVVVDIKMKGWIDRYVRCVNNDYYSAFTVAELGVMLGIEWLPYYDHVEDVWKTGIGTELKGYGTTNEAVIRAALLIHRIEMNYVKPEEVNQRLQS